MSPVLARRHPKALLGQSQLQLCAVKTVVKVTTLQFQYANRASDAVNNDQHTMNKHVFCHLFWLVCWVSHTNSQTSEKWVSSSNDDLAKAHDHDTDESLPIWIKDMSREVYAEPLGSMVRKFRFKRVNLCRLLQLIRYFDNLLLSKQMCLLESSRVSTCIGKQIHTKITRGYRK